MAQPTVFDERMMLLAYLNGQRKHVLGILEGLSEEALRRPVLPSPWTCLRLVHPPLMEVPATDAQEAIAMWLAQRAGFSIRWSELN